MAVSRDTKLVQPGTQAPGGFRSLVTPVYRGSTTLFENAAAVRDTWRHEDAAYTYGLYGTPTTLTLASRIAELEGGSHSFLVPGGQAALALVNLAFARPGEHVLMPDAVYGPHRAIGQQLLRGFGVDVEFYAPLIGAGIAALIRPTTRLVWCESPGSVTMEVQDVPAIARAAEGRGITVAIDNTYSAGVHFRAFAHGAHVSVQALTKYVGGHSDLLMGSVTVADEDRYARLGETHQLVGMAVSPDDCSLVLRGMQTLGVRLERLEASCLRVAGWLAARAEIAQVLHPAMAGSPGHDTWCRDFTGSSSVFSVAFDDRYDHAAILRFVDRLKLFRLGYSWGGVTSLAVPYLAVARDHQPPGRNLVRLNVGLEAVEDLIADLEEALAALREGPR